MRGPFQRSKCFAFAFPNARIRTKLNRYSTQSSLPGRLFLTQTDWARKYPYSSYVTHHRLLPESIFDLQSYPYHPYFLLSIRRGSNVFRPLFDERIVENKRRELLTDTGADFCYVISFCISVTRSDIDDVSSARSLLAGDSNRPINLRLLLVFRLWFEM